MIIYEQWRNGYGRLNNLVGIRKPLHGPRARDWQALLHMQLKLVKFETEIRHWFSDVWKQEVRSDKGMSVCPGPPYRMWPYLDCLLSERAHSSHLMQFVHTRYRWTRVWLTWKHGICVSIVISAAAETTSVRQLSSTKWSTGVRDEPAASIIRINYQLHCYNFVWH